MDFDYESLIVMKEGEERWWQELEEEEGKMEGGWD